MPTMLPGYRTPLCPPCYPGTVHPSAQSAPSLPVREAQWCAECVPFSLSERHNEAHYSLFLWEETTTRRVLSPLNVVNSGNNEARSIPILWENTGVTRRVFSSHLCVRMWRMMRVLSSIFGRMRGKPAEKRAIPAPTMLIIPSVSARFWWE